MLFLCELSSVMRPINDGDYETFRKLIPTDLRIQFLMDRWSRVLGL